MLRLQRFAIRPPNFELRANDRGGEVTKIPKFVHQKVTKIRNKYFHAYYLIENRKLFSLEIFSRI